VHAQGRHEERARDARRLRERRRGLLVKAAEVGEGQASARRGLRDLRRRYRQAVVQRARPLAEARLRRLLALGVRSRSPRARRSLRERARRARSRTRSRIGKFTVRVRQGRRG
jgi:hypothetical protein